MGSLSQELSHKTVMFGLKLWEVLGIIIGAIFMVILFFLALWLSSKKKKQKDTSQVQIPRVVKEIPVDLSRKTVPSKGSGYPLNPVLEDKAAIQKEVVVIVQDVATTFDKADKRYEGQRNCRSRQKAKKDEGNVEMINGGDEASLEKGSTDENKRGHHPSADRGSSASGGDSQVAKSPGGTSSPTTVISVPEVSHLGWGHWYTLRELEIATDCFSDSKVLGEGGYGIVYLGELPDGTRIAVKNLLNNRGQAEKEFKVEVEAIGRVRHKNLVRLVGYCMEGSQRMLVYEYIDNGNLAQWLHGPLGRNAPLSWDMRMKIIIGTAKGLAYLHEGLEPKVVHRDVKSSNILIDSHWNPRVSDFGLAKLLGAENSHVTTRVMGTFGYVAPEYALTGMLTEKSDIYSYGVLVMELVTGRVPVDYGRPPGEVNLVDWLKTMIGSRQFDEVADPKMESKPSPRALKRALLVALRCVDPDAQKRPKMGHVVHMLETDDGASREERKNAVRPKNSFNQGIPSDSSYTVAAWRGNTLSQAGHNGNDWESEDSRAVNSRAKWRYET